jgi:4-diphosphocytidyl-2-C-methyl-D-erythritol kinase
VAVGGTSHHVTVSAPAKINLGLEVLWQRPDGYHEVATLLQAVRLSDLVVIDLVAEPGIHLDVLPQGLDLGPPEDNLAVRAARLIPPHRGQPPGVRIRLEKRIPVGAGLGGGSADAAAVLAGLSLLRRGCAPPERLEELGATLGADVPFFFRGGTQLGVGRGDQLRPAPPWPYHPLVLIFPNLSLSTASIYGGVTFGLTPPGPLSSIGSRGFPRDFWTHGGRDLRNDLQPAVVRAEPVVASILEVLVGLGSCFAAVTGSGSGVFGVAPDEATAAAWSEQFRRQGHWSRSVRPSRGGCLIRN